MNKEAILVIQEYISDHDKPCRYFWREQYFEQWSYSRWACKELIRRIKIKMKSRPIDVVEDFVREMSDYSRKKSSSSFMFSVAKGTAEDILDIFLAMQ